MSEALIDNTYLVTESPASFSTIAPPEGTSLMLIQSTVAHFAALLASVLQLEVEVVDNRLHRVAGTGGYAKNIGQIPESNTVLLAKVMASRHEVVIFDSRKNTLCLDCQQRDQCREKGFIGVPIILKEQAIGVISLVAVDREQLTHLRSHTRMFVEYIRHVSKLFVENISVINEKYQSEAELISFLAARSSEAVLLFDSHNHIIFMNASAYHYFNISPAGDIHSAHLVDGNNQLPGLQEFTICWEDICWKVTGEWHHTHQGGLLLMSDCKLSLPDARVTKQTVPEIKSLIGNAPAMQRLKRLIVRIASSPSSVLVQGESGTGKEVVAQAIHQFSDRHTQPFVAINCAAIPENLLESELFGYVKGAFTGAAPGGKKGLIQQAHQGTLFLDEIGDMPLSLQARLLRAIERREVLPVGGTQPIKVDIRILSATHQDLRHKINDGTFREDLFYRLNVVPLYLPALRERTGDVALLLDHFMHLHAMRIGCAVPRVSKEALALLNAYAWPGNVRELSNLVEYLLNILPEGESIESYLLPPGIRAGWQDAQTISTSPVVSKTHDAMAQEKPDIPSDSAIQSDKADRESASLKLVERQMIEEALARFSNKKQVADELGIGVATLYRKIKKYGLS